MGTTALWPRASWRRSAWGTDTGLPVPDQLAIVAAPELDGPRRCACGAFVVLCFWVGLTDAARRATARWVGALALVAGVATLFVGAVRLGRRRRWTACRCSCSCSRCRWSSGGSLAAVILAHWYLVTPRISEQPLVLTTRLLTVALASSCCCSWCGSRSAIPSGPPFAALTGPQALFVWLRLIVGILFPLLLRWMAWKTALTRSMESATGLLYIELALVLASTIVGAGLAFAVGVLV